MMKNIHKQSGIAPETYPAFISGMAETDLIDTDWLEEDESEVEFRRKIENEGKIVYEIIAEC